ncbi:MAG: hypothetical protein JST23_01500, partial [Bacteroidetes bacterium]|nr:hypothetical protein [Bacteroidota bacterium]
KEVDKSFNKVLPYNLIKDKPDSFFIVKSGEIPKEEVAKSHNIKALMKDERFLKNDTITPRLSYMVSSLRTLNGDEPTLFKDSTLNADYFLFLPFAKWLGNRIQVKELKRIYNSAMFNMFSRIQVVFVNTDKQEWWGREWNDKINVNFY